MMFVRDLVSAIETLVPRASAAAWDNVGLLIGDRDAPCSRALLTIDLTPAVIDEARAMNASFVLAYHPPIFKPMKSFRARDLAYEAARAGLSVYSPHTAFDAAEFGTTATVAKRLGFTDEAVVLESSARVHSFAAPLDFAAFVALVKSAIGLEHVVVSAARDHPVTRVCVCAGAASSFVDAAHDAGADTMLVGELTHHDVLRARRLGLAVAMTFHSNTERVALEPLAARLREALPGVELRLSQADEDPLRVM